MKTCSFVAGPAIDQQSAAALATMLPAAAAAASRLAGSCTRRRASSANGGGRGVVGAAAAAARAPLPAQQRILNPALFPPRSTIQGSDVVAAGPTAVAAVRVGLFPVIRRLLGNAPAVQEACARSCQQQAEQPHADAPLLMRLCGRLSALQTALRR